MFVGIFRREPRSQSSWASHSPADLAELHSQLDYDGPTEEEPWVAQQLAALRHRLIRLHRGDGRLADAHRARDEALRTFRLAVTEERFADSEVALPLQAGLRARHEGVDDEAAHLRAEGARGEARRNRARDDRAAAEREAEDRTAALEAMTTTITDELGVEAAAAMPDLHDYVRLLNLRRSHRGKPPLHVLPADLPQRLVEETFRRTNNSDRT